MAAFWYIKIPITIEDNIKYWIEVNEKENNKFCWSQKDESFIIYVWYETANDTFMICII